MSRAEVWSVRIAPITYHILKIQFFVVNLMSSIFFWAIHFMRSVNQFTCSNVEVLLSSYFKKHGNKIQRTSHNKNYVTARIFQLCETVSRLKVWIVNNKSVQMCMSCEYVEFSMLLCQILNRIFKKKRWLVIHFVKCVKQLI